MFAGHEDPSVGQDRAAASNHWLICGNTPGRPVFCSEQRAQRGMGLSTCTRLQMPLSGTAAVKRVRHLTQLGPIYLFCLCWRSKRSVYGTALHVQMKVRMANLAKANARQRKALPIFLLILAFVSATVTCAAMTPAANAPTHPCCPKSGQDAPDHCAMTGCISVVPVLQPPSTDGSWMDFSGIAPAESEMSAAPAPIERVLCVPLRPPEFALFLRLHQFLI